jgi:NADH-quinone oxidoreductase subunit M
MLTLTLLLIPLIACLITLFLRGNSVKWFSFLASIAQLLFTLYVYFIYTKTDSIETAKSLLNFNIDWISSPKINFNIGLDGMSLLMVFLTNLLMPLIVLSGFNRNQERSHLLYALIGLMHFALIGVFVSFDGFLYYIFWELALIPIYFITLNWGGTNSSGITLKFFIYTLAGSLLMLFGFLYLYWGTPSHTLNWFDLTTNHICNCKQGFIFWMFFLAFAIKIPIIPFHTWQPDTYSTAPTQGTMLLSGIMLKMGLYSLLRWLLPIIPNGVLEYTPLAIGLCIVGVVYASVIAIMQTDIKKLFAYSSIAHVGLIAAGIFALNIQGIQGSLVQMLAHGINVVGLFYCADIIINRTNGADINNLGGIRLLAPRFATYFIIIVLGSVALPLTNSFIGEFMLLLGLFEYNSWAALVAGLTIILGAVYMLRMYQKVILGNTNENVQTFEDLKWNEELVLASICILIFAFGIFPKPMLELVSPISEQIFKLSFIK